MDSLTKKVLGMSEEFDLEKDGVTQGMLDAFATCPMKGICKAARLRSTVPKTTTRLGSLTHDLLGFLCMAASDNDQVIDEWEKKRARKGKIRGVRMDDKDGFELDLSKTLALARAYRVVYKDDMDRDYEALEEVLEAEFAGVLLKMRLDALSLDDKEKLWIGETKTKGQINAQDILSMLSFDLQTRFYLFVVELCYENPVAGISYNLIRNPSHKPSARSAETLPEFQERLTGLALADPEHFFLRMEVVHSKKDRENIERELLERITQMTNNLSGVGLWRNSAACMGRYTCEYLGACGSGKLTGYEQGKEVYPELED